MLTIQSLSLMILIIYWLINEIMRFIYVGIQRQKKKETNTITEYLKDKTRLNEMDKFNPKLFSEVNDQDSGRNQKYFWKGVRRGLCRMFKNSAKFYIFTGLLVLNICKCFLFINFLIAIFSQAPSFHSSSVILLGRLNYSCSSSYSYFFYWRS